MANLGPVKQAKQKSSEADQIIQQLSYKLRQDGKGSKKFLKLIAEKPDDIDMLALDSYLLEYKQSYEKALESLVKMIDLKGKFTTVNDMHRLVNIARQAKKENVILKMQRKLVALAPEAAREYGMALDILAGKNREKAFASGRKWALATGNPVLLADEPTGELDFRTGIQILELLKRQAETGKTVLVVTHNREISRIADRVIELSSGQVISDGEPRGGKADIADLQW